MTTSQNASDLLQQAMANLQKGDTLQAVTGFQQVLEVDPACPHTNYELSLLCLQTNQLAAAYQYIQNGLTNLLSNTPLWAVLHGLELQILLARGQLGSATQRVESLGLTPTAAIELPLRLSIAEVKRYQGQLPEAVQWIRQALAEIMAKGMPTARPLSPPQTGFAERFETQLWQTLAQLAAADVHAFPTSGTLLGLTRDGALLPFDKDVDVGLPFTEMTRAIECLQHHGWQEDRHSSGLVNPRSFRHPTGLVLDLCGFLVDAHTNTTIGGFWIAGMKWQWQRVTDYPPLNLRRQLRPEGSVWQLEDPEDWLASLYGEAWRTPDPLFDTIVGAANLRAFSPLVEYYAVNNLITHWLAGRPDKLSATLRHALHHRPDDPLFAQVQTVLQTAL